MIESAELITQDSEKYVERLLMLFRRFSLLVADAFSGLKDSQKYIFSKAFLCFYYFQKVNMLIVSSL